MIKVSKSLSMRILISLVYYVYEYLCTIMNGNIRDIGYRYKSSAIIAIINWEVIHILYTRVVTVYIYIYIYIYIYDTNNKYFYVWLVYLYFRGWFHLLSFVVGLEQPDYIFSLVRSGEVARCGWIPWLEEKGEYIPRSSRPAYGCDVCTPLAEGIWTPPPLCIFTMTMSESSLVPW